MRRDDHHPMQPLAGFPDEGGELDTLGIGGSDVRRSRAILYSMILGVLTIGLWAHLTEIDQVTRAPAQMISAARTQIVQAPEGGVVTLMHVKEGEKVTAGQLLVTLQKERLQAAVDDSSAKVAALRITLARLRAEVYGTPLSIAPELQRYQDYVRNQTDLYRRRRTALEDEVGSLARMQHLAEEELRMNSQLLETGDVSRADVLRLQRSVADLAAQQVNRRNKYFQDAQAEMTKAQEELNTQQESLRDRSQLLEHATLLAPLDGVVNNIRATTLGAVLRPGDPVMDIFPTGGELIAEAKVQTADIGFVKEGQRANVKLDAFDSSIFGAIEGSVSYISPDVLKEETPKGAMSYYRVQILIRNFEFHGANGHRIEIRPGMTATVEIKALKRTVLSFFTKPVTKTLGNALGER